MTTGNRSASGRRARRHRLAAGFVLAYLAAGGVTLALGDRVAGGGWLALHLVLLGAATNAIVVWSEHFAAALLHVAPVGERAATARTLLLNLGVVAVLGGVHAGRTAMAAAGAGLTGAVVLGHAAALAARVARALPARLGGTVWFYLAAAAALLAGMGLGLWLAGGVVGSVDAYRALRLAHVHLNVLGWVGLAVVGTQFTLWPTVLRTRMIPGVERAARWALPPLALGLAAGAAGLAGQRRGLALAGLGGYAAGLAIALVPSSARPGGGHPTPPPPSCWERGWPGSPLPSWPTWPRWPPATPGRRGRPDRPAGRQVTVTSWIMPLA
jgi:nitrite reductase (NO-forming)